MLLRKLTPAVILILLILIFSSGCDKSKYEVPTQVADFDSRFGIPVVNSTMSMGDFFSPKDSNFQVIVNSDGYYSFVFAPRNFEFPAAGDYITLSDYDLTSSGLSTIPIDGLNNNATIVPFTVSVDPNDFNGTQLKGSKIRKINYKGGKLTFSVSSTYSNTITFRLSLTSLSKNNLIATFPVVLQGYASKTFTYDLTNSILDFRGKTGNGYNTLNFNILIDKIEAGEGTGELSIDTLNLIGQKWSRMDVELGNVSFPINNQDNSLAYHSISIDPFKNLNNRASFNFEKIKLNSTMSSSYGLPLSVAMNPIQTLDKNDIIVGEYNTSQPIALKRLASPGAIMSPTTLSGGDQDMLNNLFIFAPFTFRYALKISTPGTGSGDFILDTSTIHSDTRLEIPLFGKFSDLSIDSKNDNPLLALSSKGSIDTKKSFIRFDISNAIPINFDLQITFLDASSNPVYYNGKPYYMFVDKDGLRSDFITIAANVDKDGYSTNTTSQSTIISLSDPNLSDVIFSATYLMISAVMATNTGISPQNNNSQDLSVKIRPKDKLNVNMSFAIEGTIHPSE